MSDASESLVERRAVEMTDARDEWERASEELKRALDLFRDLNRTRTSPDGDAALRNASLRESWALQKYVAAVQVYIEAVRRRRSGLPEM